jgi:hypothetical protein
MYVFNMSINESICRQASGNVSGMSRGSSSHDSHAFNSIKDAFLSADLVSVDDDGKVTAGIAERHIGERASIKPGLSRSRARLL